MIICFLCRKPIAKTDTVEHHHPIYRSRSGTETAPTHKACHRSHHSTQGDFAAWGRIGGSLTALTRAWAFNLKHIKDNPAFDTDRKFYQSFYAR
jgi:hypothetical protein